MNLLTVMMYLRVVSIRRYDGEFAPRVAGCRPSVAQYGGRCLAQALLPHVGAPAHDETVMTHVALERCLGLTRALARERCFFGVMGSASTRVLIEWPVLWRLRA